MAEILRKLAVARCSFRARPSRREAPATCAICTGDCGQQLSLASGGGAQPQAGSQAQPLLYCPAKQAVAHRRRAAPKAWRSEAELPAPRRDAGDRSLRSTAVLRRLAPAGGWHNPCCHRRRCLGAWAARRRRRKARTSRTRRRRRCTAARHCSGEAPERSYARRNGVSSSTLPPASGLLCSRAAKGQGGANHSMAAGTSRA